MSPIGEIVSKLEWDITFTSDQWDAFYWYYANQPDPTV